ncbi:MAG TPA: dihydroorotase [Opitutae bacterium]|nr:dihydroorotase [Opitutae bacterium]
MGSLIFRNAEIVNDGTRRQGDVLVRDGRIMEVGKVTGGADREIEAQGKLLLPGLIDDQVHFREPGLTHKATIGSESRAAVAGGVTSFMEMPNTKPPATSRVALEDKFSRAAATSVANYSFFLGATATNIEEIERMDTRRICGVKIFMGSSTGDLLVDQTAALERIFYKAPVPIATHCEDNPMIKGAEVTARARWGEDVPAIEHSRIRSAEACYKSSLLAVNLARRTNARLHVLHITTAQEVSLFNPGTLKGKRVTAEACVHHLWFDDRDYERQGHLIKCNPSIKEPADRAAIRRAVAEGRIDVLATDHAPHTSEEKAGTYFNAPAGLPLIQHSLLMFLDLWRQGVLPLETIVTRACHAPAELFGVIDRGYIRPGMWADLVLVDPNQPTTVTREKLLYHCGWSPLEGQTFGSSVAMTVVNGNIVYEDGMLRKDAPMGQALEFHPNRR